MTLMSILAASDNGNYFSNVAQACSMSTATAKSALERLCPAIAAQLKEKMQSDNNAFEALLDLLDEGGDLDGLTDAEAIADGKAVLDDLYGSPAAALAEMKRLAPGLSDAQTENISAIAATSVLAVLAKSYARSRNACQQHRRGAARRRHTGHNHCGHHQGLVAVCPKPIRPAAAQAAELYQLLRHAAQDHAAQTAGQNADTGRYFRANSRGGKIASGFSSSPAKRQNKLPSRSDMGR